MPDHFTEPPLPPEFKLQQLLSWLGLAFLSLSTGCGENPAAPDRSPASAGAAMAAGGQLTAGGTTSGALAGTSPGTTSNGASAPITGGTGGAMASNGGSGGTAGAGGATPEPVAPGPGCDLYASPSGAGMDCSAQAPCSLFGARDKVRTLNASLTDDLEVCLAGGTYALTETFELTESPSVHDSGSGGFRIVYRALDGETPILSGGRTITGFELHDAGKNIYRAAAASLDSRQLFVNGKRATRARSGNNYGMTRNDHGFTANTDALASFENPTRIEVTGELDWRHYRCPVESITGNNVRLQDPCWALSQDIPGGWWQFKEVSWVENAYELLDQEGEFYLDVDQGQLYYKPRAGEDIATAEVVAPVLETLVRGKGSTGMPLHHVTFRGITFAYATWGEPNTSVGYTSWQSGFLHRMPGQYYDSGFFVMPSNLVFELVDSLHFEGNTFAHLGASGLDLFHGARNSSIVGNRFRDISGRAITLGHLDDYAAPESEIIKNNLIKNNAVFESGVEYRDCAIIFIGYTQDTVVEHNWLRHGPYIGISLGWGWASHPESTAGRNLIRWNRIEDFMQHTFDGSGVYSLGIQRDSSIDHNYIYRGLPRGHGIFPDQGSAYMRWEHNVIEDVGSQWIHDWSAQAHHNVIRDNFTNQPNHEHSGGADKHDVFENNQIITDGSWPPAALDIKAKAGLQPEYEHLAD